MPSPPNDNERSAVRTRKRKGQANTPQGANVVAFPIADALQSEAATAPYLPEIQQALDKLSLTPIELLAVTIKAKLGDRIADEEVQRICQAYYVAILSIWGEEE